MELSSELGHGAWVTFNIPEIETCSRSNSCQYFVCLVMNTDTLALKSFSHSKMSHST